MLKKEGFGTRAIHAGQSPDAQTGAVMQPIYQTSTFVQDDPYTPQPFSYARVSNPTRSALESNLASLENAQFATCFASGQAATDAILKCFSAGDHIIMTQDVYGGTYRIATQVYAKFGLEFSFIDMRNLQSVQDAIRANTKLIWGETPSNPLLYLTNLQALSQIANTYNIPITIDNTFASPYLQNPLDLGATLVMHSTTKYIGGHSDVIGGAVCTNDETWQQRLQFQAKACGGVPAPMDCFLLLRGTKTLHIRMERHCQNAMQIAQFLENHPKVARVFYPGLVSHPDHKLAKQQMRDFGAMMSFELKENSVEKALTFAKSLRYFALAESLGGVESLVGHPATMSHGSMPPAQRQHIGISDSLIRLSIGIEDATDLIRDLDQSFQII